MWLASLVYVAALAGFYGAVFVYLRRRDPREDVQTLLTREIARLRTRVEVLEAKLTEAEGPTECGDCGRLVDLRVCRKDRP